MPDTPAGPARDEDARADRLTRPLVFLCTAMVVVGFLTAANDIFGLFGNWRARGVELFDQGLLDGRLDGLVAMLEGILGGSIVGKWTAALGLIKGADPRTHSWSRRALAGALVGLGLFDFGLLWAWGFPPAAGLGELAAALIVALLVWRMHSEAQREAHPKSPPTCEPRPLAWRALEAFAWANVALGVSLSFAWQTFPFATYRESLAALWFDGALPHGAVPWMQYGFGAVGAAFASHFFVLAALARHAWREHWAMRVYGGSVLVWFAVDSVACWRVGARFNVLMVNVPALAATLVLLLWASRSAQPHKNS